MQIGEKETYPDKYRFREIRRKSENGHQIKKVREKKQRIEAKFYPLAQQVIDQPIDIIPVKYR